MNLDQSLLFFFNRTFTHPILDILMSAITLLTMPAILIVPLVMMLKGHRRQGRNTLAVIVVATLLAVALQFTFRRPRPVGVRLVLSQSVFPSFPSGHMAAWCGLALLLSLRRSRHAWTAWVVSALTALSRMYLGHHFPGDVLGGAVVGLGTATVLYGYLEAPTDRPRWAWWLWGQLTVVIMAILAAYLRMLHFWVLTLPAADKVLHFILFGVLAFLGTGWWFKRPAWQVLATLGVLATLEEVAQGFSTTRSFDLSDLACTLGGIVCLGIAGHYVIRQRTKWVERNPSEVRTE